MNQSQDFLLAVLLAAGKAEGHLIPDEQFKEITEDKSHDFIIEHLTALQNAGLVETCVHTYLNGKSLYESPRCTRVGIKKAKALAADRS